MDNVVLTPEMLAVVPVIAILLQLLKSVPAIAKYSAWLPLVSVAIGIAWSLAMKMGAGYGPQVITGVIVGVAAAGSYDVVKKLGNTTPTV